jgi:uncharacterized protein
MEFLITVTWFYFYAQHMRILQYIILIALAWGIWYIAMNWLPNQTSWNWTWINVNVDVKKTVAPDIATLRVAANEIAPNAGDAQKKTSAIMAALTEVLMSGWIDKKDIQTSYFYVNPEYDYVWNPAWTLRGYRSSHEVVVKVRNLSWANDLVAQLTTVTWAAVNGFTFELENPEKSLEGVRAEAMKKLNDKANAIAQAAWVSLWKIVTLNEFANPVSGPMPVMSAKADAVAENGGANLQQGQIEITLSVSATYWIK